MESPEEQHQEPVKPFTTFTYRKKHVWLSSQLNKQVHFKRDMYMYPTWTYTSKDRHPGEDVILVFSVRSRSPFLVNSPLDVTRVACKSASRVNV